MMLRARARQQDRITGLTRRIATALIALAILSSSVGSVHAWEIVNENPTYRGPNLELVPDSYIGKYACAVSNRNESPVMFTLTLWGPGEQGEVSGTSFSAQTVYQTIGSSMSSLAMVEPQNTGRTGIFLPTMFNLAVTSMTVDRFDDSVVRSFALIGTYSYVSSIYNPSPPIQLLSTVGTSIGDCERQ